MSGEDEEEATAVCASSNHPARASRGWSHTHSCLNVDPVHIKVTFPEYFEAQRLLSLHSAGWDTLPGGTRGH